MNPKVANKLISSLIFTERQDWFGKVRVALAHARPKSPRFIWSLHDKNQLVIKHEHYLLLGHSCTDETILGKNQITFEVAIMLPASLIKKTMSVWGAKPPLEWEQYTIGSGITIAELAQKGPII